MWSLDFSLFSIFITFLFGIYILCFFFFLECIYLILRMVPFYFLYITDLDSANPKKLGIKKVKVIFTKNNNNMVVVMRPNTNPRHSFVTLAQSNLSTTPYVDSTQYRCRFGLLQHLWANVITVSLRALRCALPRKTRLTIKECPTMLFIVYVSLLGLRQS